MGIIHKIKEELLGKVGIEDVLQLSTGVPVPVEGLVTVDTVLKVNVLSPRGAGVIIFLQ